ncbi:translation initiation factor IF-2 subunit alpha [uncultured archaeon]|nr:translation initiation factor IF-2 subunit alpha [uncultured archaeon]HKJ96752.1 translation initiation factor IF-2 subunit alpha [Thermoplasmataceae archaeon]
MRKDLPENSDLVVVTIKDVKNFGATVKLDEYEGKEGFIHIAEVATGWVKHIRDHLREGQRTVCKVLNVDKERGYIDLSLKRVNAHQKREKISQWKNEQKSAKLLELAAEQLNKSVDECEEEFAGFLRKKYGTLYEAFEEAAAEENWLPEKKGKWKQVIIQLAKENVVPPFVQIGGYIESYSLAPDGMDRIKASLLTGISEGVEIQYAGAPRYRISVQDKDYKSAEETLRKSILAITESSKKNNVVSEFTRAP